MIRKFLPYFYVVLTIDLIVSPIATIFSTILSKSFLVKEITLSGILVSFIISFLTGGFLLGALLFELARKKEYSLALFTLILSIYPSIKKFLISLLEEKA